METMTNEEIIKEIWKRDVKSAIGKGWRSYSDWFNGMKQYGRNELEDIYKGLEPEPEYTPEQIKELEEDLLMEEWILEQEDKEYQESITNEFGVSCYACSVDMCEDRCWEEARRYYYWDREMKMENVFAELQSVRPAENADK